VDRIAEGKRQMQTEYQAFWDRYLRAHADPATRGVHYAGSTLALGALALAAVRRDWRWLLAAPVIGYGFAWTAHAAIEGNKPETFGHPLWSLLSDFRMLGLAASGRLHPHLERAGIPR
jgi:hypothetical protein